jgi:protein transport protein SEC61 subunit gamma-like protein
MEEVVKPTIKRKIKDFIRECKRVLIVTKKPSKDEFKTIVKVSGLGIIIIGVIGFLIQMVKQLLF